MLLDSFFFTYHDKSIDQRESINISFEKFKTINWPITFLLPIKAQKSYLVKHILSLNKNVTICYFNYIVVEGFTNFKHFIFKTGLGMPQCQNVLAASLLLTINMKYQQTYILGADHSWHEELIMHNDNKIGLNDAHFYDKSKTQPIVLTDETYRLTVSTFFLSLHKAFRAYDVIKKYADYRKVKIVNSSPKSYIDSFEKRKLS